MKKKFFLPIFLLLTQLFTTEFSFAQSPGKWSEWSTPPCYEGISISVVNMGYSNNAGGYLWGIRLRNDYRTPVTLKYRLSIGEKNTSPEGGDVVWKLKPGEIWTDGNDKFTAKLYKSSSSDFNCYIWQVCFGEATCGGTPGCYAGCDIVKGKENQPCGIGDKINNNPNNDKKAPEKSAEQNNNTTSASGTDKITNLNIAQSCSPANTVTLDNRAPDLKYCIENKGPAKPGSDLIVYSVKIYNTSGSDFMWVDIGLESAKNASANPALKKQQNIPPTLSNSVIFLFKAGENPATLIYKNVVVKDLWGNIKTQF